MAGTATGRQDERASARLRHRCPAGVPSDPSIHGKSLRPMLENPRSTGARAFAVTELANNPDAPSEQGRMLRTERFKYVVFSYGGIREQLFDLQRDPGEMYNLALDANWYDVLGEHRDLLRDWTRDTDDNFGPIPDADQPAVRGFPLFSPSEDRP